jgi:heme/copper-type cytochrome/quinol oxidase subunit 2
MVSTRSLPLLLVALSAASLAMAPLPAQRPGPTKLAPTGTVGPVLILFAIAAVLVANLPGIQPGPPASAGTSNLVVDVTGTQFTWQFTYPNGVVTSYGYDNANRLLSIGHVKTPTTIEALTYQNDAAGNRIKLTRANATASLNPQAVPNTAFDSATRQPR